MLLKIHHETKLSYTRPVSETVFEVRMSPPSDEDQTNLGFRLRINPSAVVTAYRDGFGNRVDLFNILAPYKELVVRTSTVVRTHRRPWLTRLAEVSWSPGAAVDVDAIEFLHPSPLVGHGPDVDAYLRSLPEPSGSLLSVINLAMKGVSGRLKYEKKVTTARTPVGEALRLGKGVCQDFAHLFLATCRGFRLPARYVSGYVHGPGELATHAWCQVWGGPVGWIDVDPTRGVFVEDHHVVTAVGRDYSDVPPNRGVWKGKAEETINVSVLVEAIDRVPPEWGEWGTQAPWSGASWTRSQQQERRNTMFQQAGYRQQQGQQQQG